MKHMKKVIAGGLLSASLLAGCGKSGATVEACPVGWNAEVVAEPYEVIGITSAIGERVAARTYGDDLDKALVGAYTDSSLNGQRNNADELGELFCSTPEDELKLSAHGAMLIQVAANAEMSEVEALQEYLPYQN